MQANCTICAEVFHDLSSIMATRCGHVFHATCITQWLACSKSCPICRRGIANKRSLIVLHFNEDTDEADGVVNQLLDEIRKLKHQLTVNEDEPDGLRDIATDVEQPVSEQESLRREMLRLEDENEVLSEEIARANHVHLMDEQRISALLSEQASLKTNMQTLEQEKAILSAKFESLTVEYSKDETALCQELVSEQDSLKVKLQHLEQEKDVQTKEIIRMNFENLGAERKLLQLEREQASLRATVQELEQEKTSLSAEIKRINEAHSKDEEKISQLELVQESLRSEIHQLRIEKTSQNEEIKRANDMQLVNNTTVPKLVSQEESLRATVQKLEQENTSLSEEIKRFNDGHLKDEATILQLVLKQKSLRDKIQQLEKEKTSLAEEIKHTNDVHLIDDVTASELESFRAKIRQLEQEKTNLREVRLNSECMMVYDSRMKELLSEQESLRDKLKYLEQEEAVLHRVGSSSTTTRVGVIGDHRISVWPPLHPPLAKLDRPNGSTDMHNLRMGVLLSEQEYLRDKIKQLENETSALSKEITHVQDLRAIVCGSDKNLENVLNKWGEDSETVKHIIAYIPVLKKELFDNFDARISLQAEVNCLRKNLNFENGEPSVIVKKSPSGGSPVQLSQPGSTPSTSQQSTDTNKKRKLAGPQPVIQL